MKYIHKNYGFRGGDDRAGMTHLDQSPLPNHALRIAFCLRNICCVSLLLFLTIAMALPCFVDPAFASMTQTANHMSASGDPDDGEHRFANEQTSDNDFYAGPRAYSAGDPDDGEHRNDVPLSFGNTLSVPANLNSASLCTMFFDMAALSVTGSLILFR